jgi:hypothetical protein
MQITFLVGNTVFRSSCISSEDLCSCQLRYHEWGGRGEGGLDMAFWLQVSIFIIFFGLVSLAADLMLVVPEEQCLESSALKVGLQSLKSSALRLRRPLRAAP